MYSLPEPLPYVYVQDRVVDIGDERQLDRLVSGDLRRAVYVAPDDASGLPALSLGHDPGDGPASAAEIERFAALQNVNRILRIGRERPNRTDETLPDMSSASESWARPDSEYGVSTSPT